MNRPVRLAINGATGRMGRALSALLEHDARFDLCRAVVAADSSCVGMPVFVGHADGLRYAHGWHDAPALDVIIDFSTPAALDAALEHCLANGTSLISGTTGGDATMEARLHAASEHIGMLRAANFSLGVAVLTRLLRDAAAALPAWDVEIVEAHHAGKRDAPSGTALALGHTAAQARGAAATSAYVVGRQGVAAARVADSIGYAVVRGGDIVGEHTAMLIGQGERLELVHRAGDRSIFARGALQAAYWLSQHGRGQWSMDDVLSAAPASLPPRAGETVRRD